MNRITVLISVLALFNSFTALSQDKGEVKSAGKVTGKVFWNYHYDMSSGEQKESSFEIKRAYLGYKYQMSKAFSASVTVDVGKSDGGSDYSVFLKKAQLDWKMSSVVKVSLGMIGLEQFSDQEKFWGYRYIMKSFQDQYGFGSSADLGVKANFKLTPWLNANAFVINGEGYKKIQDEDGKQKIGANLVARTDGGLVAKFYLDANTTSLLDEAGNESDVTTSAICTFVGYRFSDAFRAGAEYNVLINGTKYSSAAIDHDMEGISVYSTYAFNKKFELFGRYDYVTSNSLKGEIQRWNLAKNGSAITSGVQYSPVKGVKMALNYQGFMHKDIDKSDRSNLFVNFEFKF